MRINNKILLNQIAVVLAVILLLTAHDGQAAGSSASEKNEGQVITITDGISRVLKYSPLIKVTLPDDEIAFQASILARSTLLPQINATAGQTFLKYQPASKFNSTAVNTSERNYFSYGVDVYQTLFDFGQSLAAYHAGKDLFQAAQAHTESIKRLAVLEFISAYFNLLEREKMIAVFEREVESLSSYLSDIEHLYQQGMAVENDLLPVKVRLADVKQRLIESRNNREIAMAKLNNILGLPLMEKITGVDMNMPAPELPQIEASWNKAMAQRPEINFFDKQIKAAKSSEWSKRVGSLPTIFVDGGYTFDDNEYQVHEKNASVMLGAKLNFYDGGRTAAEANTERARQKKLTREKEKLVEDIKLEIEESYFGLKNACEKVAVAKEALAQAEENVRFYRAKYQAGSANSTEVLEAISLQTVAQTNYYNDDYEMKRGIAKLLYSTGADLPLIYQEMEKKNGPVKW